MTETEPTEALPTPGPTVTSTPPSASISTALVPTIPPVPEDVTRAYFLSPSSTRNYDALTEQLLEDDNRPQKTKVHLDVNLSVDLDLTPEIYGDLHLSLLCVTIKRKPNDPADDGTNEGRRIAGTILRVSDGRNQLLHRQVIGLESFSEWWLVARIQLRQLIRRQAMKIWVALQQYRTRATPIQVALLIAFPLSLIVIFFYISISAVMSVFGKNA